MSGKKGKGVNLQHILRQQDVKDVLVRHAYDARVKLFAKFRIRGDTEGFDPKIVVCSTSRDRAASVIQDRVRVEIVCAASKIWSCSGE